MAVTIYPEPGNRDSSKYIAGVLLNLADNVHDVQTVSRPNLGFRVSDELYEKFVAFQSSPTSEPVNVESGEAIPKPAKRAGRPKKEGS